MCSGIGGFACTGRSGYEDDVGVVVTPSIVTAAVGSAHVAVFASCTEIGWVVFRAACVGGNDVVDLGGYLGAAFKAEGAVVVVPLEDLEAGAFPESCVVEGAVFGQGEAPSTG